MTTKHISPAVAQHAANECERLRSELADALKLLHANREESAATIAQYRGLLSEAKTEAAAARGELNAVLAKARQA